MPRKSKASKPNTTAETTQNSAKAAEKARKAYEETVRTGQRVAEQTQEWWTRMFTQMATGNEWQKQWTNFTSIAGNMLPMAQRRIEEMAEWAAQNNRTSTELMRKAWEALQTPVLADSQNKWMDFWSSSLRAVQSNIDTATDLGTKTIDNWIRFVRENTEVTEVRTAKAA